MIKNVLNNLITLKIFLLSLSRKGTKSSSFLKL